MFLIIKREKNQRIQTTGIKFAKSQMVLHGICSLAHPANINGTYEKEEGVSKGTCIEEIFVSTTTNCDRDVDEEGQWIYVSCRHIIVTFSSNKLQAFKLWWTVLAYEDLFTLFCYNLLYLILLAYNCGYYLVILFVLAVIENKRFFIASSFKLQLSNFGKFGFRYSDRTKTFYTTPLIWIISIKTVLDRKPSCI